METSPKGNGHQYNSLGKVVCILFTTTFEFLEHSFRIWKCCIHFRLKSWAPSFNCLGGRSEGAKQVTPITPISCLVNHVDLPPFATVRNVRTRNRNMCEILVVHPNLKLHLPLAFGGTTQLSSKLFLQTPTSWWFRIFLFIFTPKIGDDFQFDVRIFFKWVGSTTKLGQASSF